MRAATTKIPHLLYEKGLLKTPNEMYDFIYNWWLMWWEWEKNPEIYKKIQKRKQRKKFTAFLHSHHPVYEMEADCFPMSENTENEPNRP